MVARALFTNQRKFPLEDFLVVPRPQRLQVRRHLKLGEPAEVGGINDVEVCYLVPLPRTVPPSCMFHRVQAFAYCTVADEALNPANPGTTKVKYTPGSSSAALGFSIADFVYYGYQIESAAAACDRTALTQVYTLIAMGDLDGDNTNSTFELAVQVDTDMTLYHARGFYIDQEIE